MKRINQLKEISQGDNMQLGRSEIIYIVQLSVVFIAITVSISNLALKTGEKDVWICLLSSAIGYILPSPTITVESTCCGNINKNRTDSP